VPAIDSLPHNPSNKPPASPSLHTAFQSFTTDPTSRALLITITSESLVPHSTIPSTSANLTRDLSALHSALSPNEPLYIILRPESPSTGLIAITYVPDAAPVRQKTLFASTRLTLLRELGSDSFGENLFITERDELSGEGWERHERHVREDAPLTREEWEQKKLKEEEAIEVGGTGRRGAGYGGSSSGLRMDAGPGVVEALKGLEGKVGGLVLLGISQAEEIVLVREESDVGADKLSARIGAEEPMYSFYQYGYVGEGGQSEEATVFIYTCPAATPVKQRMIYASSKRSVETLAESHAGLTLARKLEATDSSEISAQTLEDEFKQKAEQKSGFARPKRPGRR
jgi:twinfilin-like protein